MVNDALDAFKVCLDDDRSVADAGVLLAATLARRLGIEALVNECVDHCPGCCRRRAWRSRVGVGRRGWASDDGVS